MKNYVKFNNYELFGSCFHCFQEYYKTLKNNLIYLFIFILSLYRIFVEIVELTKFLFFEFYSLNIDEI